MSNGKVSGIPPPPKTSTGQPANKPLTDGSLPKFTNKHKVLIKPSQFYYLKTDVSRPVLVDKIFQLPNGKIRVTVGERTYPADFITSQPSGFDTLPDTSPGKLAKLIKARAKQNISAHRNKRGYLLKPGQMRWLKTQRGSERVAVRIDAIDRWNTGSKKGSKVMVYDADKQKWYPANDLRKKLTLKQKVQIMRMETIGLSPIPIP